MSDPAADSVVAEPTAPALDPGDINYDLPNAARTGAQPDKDGDGPGEPDAEAEKEPEKAAADAEPEKPKRTLVGDLQKERERARTAEATLESWRPIIARLDGRPDLQTAVIDGRVTIAQAEAAKEREDKAELVEIAEDLGYYTKNADGTFNFEKPDLDRAERYRARHLKWAKQTAEPMVQPLTMDSQLSKAMARVEAAVQYAIKEGDADPDIVREELTAAARKNPAWLLDNDAGNLLYDRAVAKTVREQKAGRLKAKPEKDETDHVDRRVVHTESPGGKRTGPRLTASEKALGEQYGLTDKDWDLAERHAGVRRGYTRLTED